MARGGRARRAGWQRWTEEEARAALARLDASGMSLAAFARREGVSTNKLKRWRRRLASCGTETVAPAFIEIQRHLVGSVEVVLRSQRVLRVSESIDPAVLRRLVAALEDTAGC